MTLVTTLRRERLAVKIWLDPDAGDDPQYVVEAYVNGEMVDAQPADTIEAANALTWTFADEYANPQEVAR